MFGPPQGFTPASTCSWLGHQVSGLRLDTFRPVQTRFRFGSETLSLNLASHRNSPAHSTKGTTSDWLPVVLCLLVSTRFQVLFHSPPGVLFTFPSRYYSLSVTWSYLALWDGPHIFRQNSSCSDVLVVSGQRLFSPTSLSLSLGLLSNNLRLRSFRLMIPEAYFYTSFGLVRFRSPLLAESFLLSFPPGTKMFQFPGFPSYNYGFS